MWLINLYPDSAHITQQNKSLQKMVSPTISWAECISFMYYFFLWVFTCNKWLMHVFYRVLLSSSSALIVPLVSSSCPQAGTQLANSPLASPTQSPAPSPSGSVNSVCPGLGPLPLISQFSRPGGPAQGTPPESHYRRADTNPSDEWKKRWS